MEWITENKAALTAAILTTWSLVSIIVKLTPSKADDRFLRRVAEWLSFFLPPNIAGLFKVPGRAISKTLRDSTPGLADELEPETKP